MLSGPLFFFSLVILFCHYVILSIKQCPDDTQFLVQRVDISMVISYDYHTSCMICGHTLYGLYKLCATPSLKFLQVLHTRCTEMPTYISLVNTTPCAILCDWSSVAQVLACGAASPRFKRRQGQGIL